MDALRPFGFLACLVLASCQTYSPAPVDLTEHARQFAERMPDAESIRRFAEQLHSPDPALQSFDLSDGLSLAEGRYIALLFHPDLRVLRLRTRGAKAAADVAGRWADPELSGDFQKILENVAHPWLAAGAIGITLPITGRPGLERELALSQHAEALVAARIAEATVLDRLEGTWARWSAARLIVLQLEDLVQRLTELAAVAVRLSAAQLLTLAEARTFQLELVAQQAHLVKARANVATAEIDLKQVLGLPADRALTFLPSLAIEDRRPGQQARLAQLADGPALALARCAHEVAERQLALAIRKQWPELHLLPGFQEEDAEPRAALGFSLPLPLWNGNAREIAESAAARDIAAEVMRGGLERASQDLARAEVRREASRNQRNLIDTQLVPLAEQQVADGRRLAELGQLNTLLLLDTLTRAHAAKTLAIETALTEAEATIAINTLFWPAIIWPVATANHTEAR